MANLNRVFLIGNLTRDPEVRYTPKGTAVTELGLAVNRTYTTDQGEKKEETTFIDVEFWGRQAEVVAETLGIDLATAPRDPGEELPTAVETIMVMASMQERRPHHHRALDDAEEERRRWIKVREMAEKQKGWMAS